MNPWKMAKSGTEHAHQCALFSWATIASQYGFDMANNVLAYDQKGYLKRYGDASKAVTELRWLFAIPNGGSRGGDKRSAQIIGAQMKAEGVKPGVADMMLPVPRHNLCGLFIELKREDGGAGLSPLQREFGAFVQKQSYGFAQALGWEAAADILMRWFSHPQKKA